MNKFAAVEKQGAVAKAQDEPEDAEREKQLDDYYKALALIECLVTLFEAVLITWIARLAFRKGLMLSMLANGCSWLFGFLIS